MNEYEYISGSISSIYYEYCCQLSDIRADILMKMFRCQYWNELLLDAERMEKCDFIKIIDLRKGSLTCEIDKSKIK